MTKEKESLFALRDQIDKVDDSILELLNQRALIIDQVRDLKEKQVSKIKMRPGREAGMLYRLMSKQKGRFPKRELAQIWRQIIVATIGFEGPFSMAVYYNEDETGFWDLARDQYGSTTPVTFHSSTRRVLEAVQTETAIVGVVPIPQHDDRDNWWHLIVSDRVDAPKIVARLPFIGYGNARSKGLEAFVLCKIEHEAIDNAHSVIAVESNKDIGFNTINSCLVQADLKYEFQQVWHNTQRPPEWTYFIELSEFLIKEQEKESALINSLKKHDLRLVHLGGYAKPLEDADFVTETIES